MATATASSYRSTSTSPPETFSGMVISLVFWLFLFAAGILFAIVSLSPKLLVYLQLRSQFDVNQRRLVMLEQQAEQLRRVINAIRTDTDFAAELTRIEFDAVLPGEEVIPVDSALKLDARSVETPLPDFPAASEWYEPLVNHLASDHELRMGFLACAMLLVIVSFTLLQPMNHEQIATASHPTNSIWRNLRKRYARQT